MRLESALFASREGLNAHGQAISVVGDNIANSNTTGYKRSRVEFADLFSGNGESVSPTIDEAGGAGVKVSAVRQIQDVGVLEPTGRSLDVGIAGEGFFIVSDGTSQYYTRAGNFAKDKEGFLVDREGNYVMGFDGGTSLQKLNLTNVDTVATPTTAIAITGNLNASDAVGTPPTAPGSFNDLQDSGAASFISNVNLYDSLGKAHSVRVAFTKTDAATRTWTAQAFIDGGELAGGTAGTPVLIGTYAGLTFNEQGNVPEASRATSIITATTAAFANGAAASSSTINLGGFTQMASGSQINTITNNGQGTGDITGYEINNFGEIIVTLDSGIRETVGTIALADFNNPDALNRKGDATYTAGDSAELQTPSAPGSSGLGKLEGGALERSTVDIAQEFIELVMFQRGYQANSQTLNATNGLIRDTLGLIR